VEEDVGVGSGLQPPAGKREEFAVALLLALVVGGGVGAAGEVDFVRVGNRCEIGCRTAMDEEDVAGSKSRGFPNRERFRDGRGRAVVEQEEKGVGLRRWGRNFPRAGEVHFAVGGEGDFAVPVGQAALVLRHGDEGVVEAQHVDAPVPGQDEPSAKAAAGAAVDHLRADEAEEPDGEVAQEAFHFEGRLITAARRPRRWG